MKLFHGWRIVMAGGSLQFLQSLLLNQAFGAYLAVLVEDRGWSNTSVAGAAALKTPEVTVLGPLIGWMIDRSGPHFLDLLGLVTFGMCMILLAQIDTLPDFH